MQWFIFTAIAIIGYPLVRPYSPARQGVDDTDDLDANKR
jgi:hypothetical protein